MQRDERAMQGWLSMVCVLAVLACVLVTPDLHAEGTDEDTPKTTTQVRPVREAIYNDPYKDGLYSTIVSMLTTGAPAFDAQKEIKIELKEFKKDLEVKLTMQDGPAPLVVVLVGVDGKSDTYMGRYFPYLLHKYMKVHTLCFDSTFRPTFAKASRFGVTGNVSKECELIGKIIENVLANKDLKGKVTKVGVMGYSLGATQTMTLARMHAENKLPFKLSAALALSPPIKMETTAKLLDGFYTKDRWNYTRIDMGKTFLMHEPVKPGEKIPFEAGFMRAGIGTIIRDEFTDIVERNDYLFRLKQIPDEDNDDGYNREEVARAWGFQRFMEKMSFPYWKKEKAYATLGEFWAGGDLTRTMTKLPDFARAVVCADDPFNDPADLEVLKKAVPEKNLILLPHGGHLGYMGDRWCYIQMLQMFKFK